ncbi:hypothetical protein C8R47DRAFT_1064266 [Mycena vitilis]|nr:hypothetical protein C8R47DRAFT_1064266 [Mycena vitilis]
MIETTEGEDERCQEMRGRVWGRKSKQVKAHKQGRGRGEVSAGSEDIGEGRGTLLLFCRIDILSRDGSVSSAAREIGVEASRDEEDEFEEDEFGRRARSSTHGSIDERVQARDEKDRRARATPTARHLEQWARPTQRKPGEESLRVRGSQRAGGRRTDRRKKICGAAKREQTSQWWVRVESASWSAAMEKERNDGWGVCGAKWHPECVGSIQAVQKRGDQAEFKSQSTRVGLEGERQALVCPRASTMMSGIGHREETLLLQDACSCDDVREFAGTEGRKASHWLQSTTLAEKNAAYQVFPSPIQSVEELRAAE